MVFCWPCRTRFNEYDFHPRSHWRKHHHAYVTAFFLLSASILLMFIALSLPIIKSIYLLRLDGHPASSLPATSIGTEIRVGVWGFCISSALNKPTAFTNNGECIGPQLGYTIDPTILAAVTNEPDLANFILKALTILLILHPIAAVLAFLAALPVIASCCVFHLAPWVISLVLSVATAIVSTIVFVADLALVIVAKNKIKHVHGANNLTISFGNGVWVVLVSMLFTWIALVLLSARACGCCGLRR
ncbi:actin cortical patch SUR7/pH-response regulator pali [Russula dissimulans]|nr:actin cortical patch SUR7/pH-response regulator pali [Russula dissimulans]